MNGLNDILKKIQTPSNNKYDNAGEHLKTLQNWVHTAKEKEEVDAATEAFVDADGLRVLLQAVKDNPVDTVIANRALEVLAGEVYSNGSLPILDSDLYCAKLVDLGVLDVLFAVLNLADLQAISRGLACRAIRMLCRKKKSVISDIVKGKDRIPVLLAQVYHVDRPYVFQALAQLTRASTEARQQVREQKGCLQLLLHKFAQKPYDYAPEDDPPGATVLFLTAWSWEEIKKEFPNLADNELETSDVLQRDMRRRYKWYNHAVDIVSPMTDFVSEMGNFYFYYTTAKYQFFGITLVGVLFNTTMSTKALLLAKTTNPIKVILNIITFGYYNLVREGRKSYNCGIRSDAIMGLKTFKSINSMFRFLVGTYSLLIAGYLEGYPELTGAQLYIRWASIMSSLFFIPGTLVDVVITRTLPGKRDYGQAFRGWSRQTSFLPSLALYQGSEIMAQLTLLLFQLQSRPVGIAVLWFGQFTLLYLYVLITSGCSWIPGATLVPMMQAIFWTTSGGNTVQIQQMSKAASFLRILSLLGAWLWIYLRMRKQQDLMDHLWYSQSNLVLIGLALGGTIMHILCYFQQLIKGRWWFEDMDIAHSLYAHAQGEYSQLKDDTAALHVGGLYNTAGDAPVIVADRWKKVHERLDSPTARVPLDAYLAVHKDLASDASPGRALGPQSAYMDFINALFTAATALMYPKQKKDLGKHCFGYSSLISNEYYEAPDTIPDKLGLLTIPAIGWFDPLKVTRVELNDDWNVVEKNSDNTVSCEVFKKVLLKRHSTKLGGIDEAIDSFNLFLEKVFDAMRRISGSSSQQKIDQHGFMYGALFAYEFYFADARDAERAEGCGCSTPVADTLGITIAPPQKKKADKK